MQLLPGLIDFVMEKCKHSERRLSIRNLAKEFSILTKTKERIRVVEADIYRFRLNIPKFDVDFETRVRLHATLGYKISDTYLEKLNEFGHVEFDENRTIRSYKSKDDSFRLSVKDEIHVPVKAKKQINISKKASCRNSKRTRNNPKQRPIARVSEKRRVQRDRRVERRKKEADMTPGCTEKELVTKIPPQETISITRCLESLRNVILTLGISELADLEKEIIVALEKYRESDLKIDSGVVAMAVEALICEVTEGASCESPTENYTSLNKFLVVFRSAIFSMKAIEVEKILNLAKNMQNEDDVKRISNESIRIGLKNAFEKALT